jgi:hypothetical protein
LDRARRNTVANDKREKISANYTEHADDGDADQEANGGIQPRGQIKRMNESADDSDNEDKQKAYKDDVHE